LACSWASSSSRAFDRTLPARATQVEYLTLDGIGISAGEYTLRLKITDRVNQRAATRVTRLSVRE